MLIDWKQFVVVYSFMINSSVAKSKCQEMRREKENWRCVFTLYITLQMKHSETREKKKRRDWFDYLHLSKAFLLTFTSFSFLHFAVLEYIYHHDVMIIWYEQKKKNREKKKNEKAWVTKAKNIVLSKAKSFFLFHASVKNYLHKSSRFHLKSNNGRGGGREKLGVFSFFFSVERKEEEKEKIIALFFFPSLSFPSSLTSNDRHVLRSVCLVLCDFDYYYFSSSRFHLLSHINKQTIFFNVFQSKHFLCQFIFLFLSRTIFFEEKNIWHAHWLNLMEYISSTISRDSSRQMVIKIFLWKSFDLVSAHLSL